jgi:hypothetical protein
VLAADQPGLGKSFDDFSPGRVAALHPHEDPLVEWAERFDNSRLRSTWAQGLIDTYRQLWVSDTPSMVLQDRQGMIEDLIRHYGR